MADVIRRLIANGLVQRRRSKADARAFHIKLTPSGHDTLKRAQVVVSATDEKAMQKFAASARREFVRFLQEIIDSSPLTDAQSGAKPNPTGRR
jgi:DNA-binding MarR family transcriptional regulator